MEGILDDIVVTLLWRELEVKIYISPHYMPSFKSVSLKTVIYTRPREYFDSKFHFSIIFFNATKIVLHNVLFLNIKSEGMYKNVSSEIKISCIVGTMWSIIYMYILQYWNLKI